MKLAHRHTTIIARYGPDATATIRCTCGWTTRTPRHATDTTALAHLDTHTTASHPHPTP